MLAESLKQLVAAVSSNDSVRAIGLSAGDRPLPAPGQGDVDLFIYCTEIPEPASRLSALQSLDDRVSHISIASLSGSHWGIGDCLSLEGVETWLMYFTVEEATRELEYILGGQFLDRLDNYFYPTGRLAMWQSMRGLYDPDGLLSSFKSRLHPYPPDLTRAMIEHHMSALKDVEDLQRAVLRRDVLFFHFALDLALDHFLQALFALNREYFPSRKRSEEYIERFTLKPAECISRLGLVLSLATNAGPLDRSFSEWQSLVKELFALATEQLRKPNDMGNLVWGGP